ncbi:energy-coupling factor transporter transmembrane component T family protein [Haploplasma modicum]|uniref:energy-coupling factor transporter transmembrane component T family protein n=1 Tax=Haploplasma modicum TaxID=2150 RepID=UPI00047B36A6|nr:energy-coupling factor transporter transmembrane component T [Haploplasma modicum]
MNNKISIGQYIPTNSILHRLDPRIKIISLVLMLVSLFLIPINSNLSSLIMLGSLLVISFILNLVAKIPFKKVIRGLKPLIFLLTFTFVIQLFTIKEGNPILNETLYLSFSSIGAILVLLVLYNVFKRGLPFRTILFFVIVFLVFYLQYLLPYGTIYKYQFAPTDEGIIRGLFLFVRIMITVLLTSLLTFTTMTTDLNFGFESILKPLKIIKVPVDVFAMMLSLILRYIPTLLFETDKIMKAQASRGLDFNESKLKDKINQMIALLIPIFLISITRSEELSDAMEARGYVIGQRRTRIDEYKISIKDILTLTFSILVITAIIFIRIKL